jgi:predicted RNA-binding protein with PUA-like domain
MRFWLFKSEPDVFSFADLKARGSAGEPWTGVRNYQARNSMRDDMSLGDLGLFYHSSCAEPGIAGVLKVHRTAFPDSLQFEPDGEYYDAKSTAENPRWLCVSVAFKAGFKKFVSLETLRNDPALVEMLILRKGNRLSITEVTEEQFQHICQLGGLK